MKPNPTRAAQPGLRWRSGVLALQRAPAGTVLLLAVAPTLESQVLPAEHAPRPEAVALQAVVPARTTMLPALGGGPTGGTREVGGSAAAGGAGTGGRLAGGTGEVGGSAAGGGAGAGTSPTGGTGEVGGSAAGTGNAGNGGMAGVGGASLACGQPGYLAISAMATGYAHTCVLTTAGAIRCWGDNSHGQLGDGSTNGRLAPPASDLLTGVRCWGRDDYGQLGDGALADRLLPPASDALSEVAAITAGSSHTCALTTTGGVRCWGNGARGELGDGTVGFRWVPTGVVGMCE